MRASSRPLLSIAACSLAAAAGAAPLNEAARAELLLPRGVPPDAAVKARVAAGHNVQVMVTIPGARVPGGPLLDPGSVRIEWGGEPLRHFVYCKSPDTALVFARIDPAMVRIRPEAELSMSLGLLGEEGAAAGWRLPIAFSPQEVERAESAELAGRPIELVLPDGSPARDGELFGQRREDLWAVADSEGVVLLDAATRNAAGPHYARGPQHWTVPFDPVTSQTVTVPPRRTDAVLAPVKARFIGPGGQPVERALLWVAETYHAAYEAGAAKPILVPRAGCDVLVVAAGCEPKRVPSSALGSDQAITLSPLPAPPPTR